MKLAFFSPLNPIQSGISDYSEELLSTLHGAKVEGRPVDIDLFIDRGYTPTNTDITRRFDVHQGKTFAHVAARYDATLYQMGNSSAHAYIYNELLRHPGVVVMHEFVLHHLRVWMTLNGGKRKEYVQTMERQYGEEGREAARRVLLGQFPEALFKYPLSDTVIKAATGVIVHSHYMAGLVRDVRSGVPLAVVPMGVPLPPFIPKAEARARLGLDPDLFLVTSVGHLNPYKRVSVTLQAFKALLMEMPNSLYLLVGSRSPNYDPTRQIEMLGLQNNVKSTGYVSPEEFPYYLAASDVCINLRHPTAGETSASLLRIMGAGVPVLVSRTGSFEELPDNAAGKIDIDDSEEDLLLEHLFLLAHRPDLREAMSHSARQFVAQHHTLEQAAQGYLQFLANLNRSPNTQAPQITLTHSTPTIAHLAPPNSTPVTPISIQPPQPTIRNSKFEIRNSNDMVGLVAEAAADLGIEEGDDAILSVLAGALDGLVPPRSSHGPR